MSRINSSRFLNLVLFNTSVFTCLLLLMGGCSLGRKSNKESQKQTTPYSSIPKPLTLDEIKEEKGKIVPPTSDELAPKDPRIRLESPTPLPDIIPTPLAINRDDFQSEQKDLGGIRSSAASQDDSQRDPIDPTNLQADTAGEASLLSGIMDEDDSGSGIQDETDKRSAVKSPVDTAPVSKSQKITVLDSFDSYEEWVAKIQQESPNQVVVINFWGVDCAPCIEELPCLNQLQDRYSGQVKIIAFCSDPVSRQADIMKTIGELKLDNLHFYLRPPGSDIEFHQKVDAGYSADPFTVVYGKTGEKLGTCADPLSCKEWEKMLNQALAGKPIP